MANERVSIEQLYEIDIKREKDTIYQISVGNNVEGQVNGLWYYNQTFALYTLSKGEVDFCKNYLYHCGRIDEYLIKKYDHRILDSGTSHLLYAVLSDNIPLMLRYAELGHSKYVWMVEHGHSTLLYAVQQIIKEDWERLRWSLDIMASKNQKLNKVLLPDRKFFEGMLERNEAKIVEAIKKLLKDHKKRNKHMAIAQDYISIPALGYVKLAWLKRAWR